MARTESIAIAGYYPTPVDQIPLIAARMAAVAESMQYGHMHANEHFIIDPCAGDGEAVQLIAQAVLRRARTPDEDGTDGAVTVIPRPADNSVRYYTCELEEGRHKALQKRLERVNYWNHSHALHGDAFRITFDGDGAGLLYLNPPYDTDREHGRLEEKFLLRFLDALADQGILVYVVPHYALKASARTLGQHFRKLRCYRFRGEAYNTYRQVVLYAERSTAMDEFEPDQEIVDQVEAWAADDSSIPELPLDGDPDYTIPHATRLGDWKMREIDIAALLGKFKPWHETTRARGLAPVQRVLPDLPVVELMHRTYEVAVPPRPAHIAAGIAAGLFNGQRIEPDNAKSKLPPLLVKGVFDREWRTIEEKHNKEGEKTSEVQVQQPKLVVTILDLETHKYHTIRASTEATRSAPTVSEMSIADLLKYYGQSLMGVMERQCRIVYDPREKSDIELAATPRKLFTAQAHAVRACVKLFRERPHQHPLLLGEIGSGKTTCALVAGKTIGKSCFLVLCPPHLLDSWKNEVAAVMPEALCVVLQSISDVDGIGELTVDQPVVAILSRETAKLGHSWESVGDRCPRCGLETPRGVDLAKKRARCERKTLVAGDDYARLAHKLALHLHPHTRSHAVRSILDTPLLKRPRRVHDTPEYRGLPEDLALEILSRLAHDYVHEHAQSDARKKAIAWLFAAAPNSDRLVKFVSIGHTGNYWGEFAEELPLLLPPGSNDLAAMRDALSRCATRHYDPGTPLSRVEKQIAARDNETHTVRVAGCEVSIANGQVLLDGHGLGSLEAAESLLDSLAKVAQWHWTDECGEPLFQAVPEPRRHPLAQYIVNRHKTLFDFLVIDEGHEYQNGDSAQGMAAHRLTTLGLPTIFMTGSVMNGYAASLHANMWALSPDYRAEFGRGDMTAFCDRYGYRKRVVQDKKDGEVIAFGSQTDRVERSERDAGNAPGVLPLFLFRHLLPQAVTLHKADLRIDLPALEQAREAVEPDSDLLTEYKRLLKALTDQIKEDRFEEGLSGKLFGALSELPSFLDRATADVGNGEGGAYEIRYPESCGGALVATAKMLPATTILPKERWMLSAIERELSEGRNVMVFAWHLSLLPRLQQLIQERIGEPVAVLYADKIPTAKRQAWIDREIVKKKRRVMLANPVCIQTGLNNLVHFATEIWHENPACNPIVYRQAIGRIDRIGQKLPTRVLFGHYAQTLQANMYELLLAKVAISTATDGLDPESALRASGIVEDEYLTGLSIGKQLWAMMQEGADISVPTKKSSRKKVA